MEKFLTGKEVMGKWNIRPIDLVELVQSGLEPIDPDTGLPVLIISEFQYKYLLKKGEVDRAVRSMTEVVKETHGGLFRIGPLSPDGPPADFTTHPCLILEPDTYGRRNESQSLTDGINHLKGFFYREKDLTGLLGPHGSDLSKPYDGHPIAKPRQHAKISQQKAAEVCGVSRRTIVNWEKGKGTPDKYPGRYDRANLLIWANDYRQLKALKRTTRAMNRAGKTDPSVIESIASRDGFSDEDE